MATAEDVAAAIIEDTGGTVDQMQLQKLLYFAQAWHLVWYGTPLFEEPLRAYRWGPVVWRVWKTYTEYGRKPIPEPKRGDPRTLGTVEREALRAVLQGYRGYSGLDLMRLTHSDDPWRRHRHRDEGYEIIPRDELLAHYKQLGVFGGRAVPINDVDPGLVQRARDGDAGAFAEALEQGLGVKVKSVGPFQPA
jgi:uncharacterized phage-associated protein